MNYRTLCCLFFLLGTLLACEQEEGCLDPEAVNYQVSADKDCCCEYQPLSITLFPLIHNEQYIDTLLLDTVGTPVYLKDFNLYLSHFSLFKTDSAGREEVSVVEEMPQVEGEKDDIVLLKDGSFSYDIGSVVTEGDFDLIRFYFGLNPAINEKQPADFDAHPLAEKTPGMYDANSAEYLFANMELQVDQDSVRQIVQGNDFYQQVDINHEFSIARRGSFNIRLGMRLDKYYEGVDFLNDDENIIRQKIVNNLDSVFIWNP